MAVLQPDTHAIYPSSDVPDESGVVAIDPKAGLNCIQVHYRSEQHVNYARALYSEADFRSLESNSHPIQRCIISQIAPPGSSFDRKRKLTELDKSYEDSLEHKIRCMDNER